MRVIAEIITYLDGEGLLDGPDLERLRLLGFLPSASPGLDSAGGLDPSCSGESDDGSTEGDEDDAYGRIAGRPSRRSRGRRRGGAGSTLVGARIMAAWPDWTADLGGLTHLARTIGIPGDLDGALRLLRNASTDMVDGAVEKALRGGCSLDLVWKAIGFEGYRDLLPAAGGGSVAMTGRAILASADAASLGRYAAMLRHEGFARLFLLVQVQRAVLAAFGRRLATEPLLFDRPLFARDYNPTAYWSLTFALSAMVAEGAALPVWLHAPARSGLRGDEETRAWRCAAAMSGKAIGTLLARLAEPGEAEHTLLLCPVAWDVTYRRRRATPITHLMREAS